MPCSLPAANKRERERENARASKSPCRMLARSECRDRSRSELKLSWQSSPVYPVCLHVLHVSEGSFPKRA